MNWTGLIFGIIAAACLIYLVPLFLYRRDSGLSHEAEPVEPFTASVTIVRRGTPLDTPDEVVAVVSTPLNRRAALRELAELDAGAARRRRRRVLAVLVLATLAVGVLAIFEIVAPWTPAIPGALVVAFLVVARFSVRVMRRKLDARADVIRGGADVDEVTIAIPSIDEEVGAYEKSVELTAPVESPGSLWDPHPGDPRPRTSAAPWPPGRSGRSTCPRRSRPPRASR